MIMDGERKVIKDVLKTRDGLVKSNREGQLLGENGGPSSHVP